MSQVNNCLVIYVTYMLKLSILYKLLFCY